MSSYQLGSIGPYDIEAWYSPESDMITIKFRDTVRGHIFKDNEKRGVLLKITTDAINAGMKNVHEGCEYPQIALVMVDDLKGRSHGIQYTDGSADLYQKARDKAIQQMMKDLTP